MALCLKKIRGLKTLAKIVNCRWLFTEAHSNKLLLRITARADILEGKAQVEQSFNVQGIVHNMQCDECKKVRKNTNSLGRFCFGHWRSLVSIWLGLAVVFSLYIPVSCVTYFCTLSGPVYLLGLHFSLLRSFVPGRLSLLLFVSLSLSASFIHRLLPLSVYSLGFHPPRGLGSSRAGSSAMRAQENLFILGAIGVAAAPVAAEIAASRPEEGWS